MATCLQVRCVGCRLAHPSSPLQGPGPGPTCKSGAGWTAAKAAAAPDLSRTAPNSKRWGFMLTNGGWPWDFHLVSSSKMGELISSSRRIIIRLGMWLPSNKMKLHEASPWNNKTSAIQKKRFAKQNVATAKRQTCQNPAVNPLPACTETTRPNLWLRITSLFPQICPPN